MHFDMKQNEIGIAKIALHAGTGEVIPENEGKPKILHIRRLVLHLTIKIRRGGADG